MARRTKESKKNNINRELLWEAIKNKKIAVLTLDSRWNMLFEDARKQPVIKKLVKQLNGLFKEQGGTVNKVKDMKVLKKKLMNNVIDNMEESSDENVNKLRNRKQEANHKLIGDINSQLSESSDRLMELPYEIQRVNQELLLESMLICYDTINTNNLEINALDADIERLNEQLREARVRKVSLEKETNAMYSFMHDMVGGEIIDIFDRQLGNDNNN